MSDDIDIRDSWNRIAAEYQRRNQIPTEYVHYGPHCPNEDQLQLVGDVRGKRVLEIGCGGGQCAIAFAKRGAVATGIDLSDAQVEFARSLAERERVQVTFLRGNIEDLSPLADESQEVVFSAYGLGYVEHLDRCFAEVRRVLVPGGLFVFSGDHPFWHCLAEQSLTIACSYHDRSPDLWHWTYEEMGIRAPMRSFHRTVGDWFRALTSAGLEVLDIVEPEPVESGSGQDWGDYYSPERQRMVPATIIFKSRKPG